MIINPYLVQPSGPSYGTLTTAWIAATGETDLTILGALNTLESDLTTYGLTSKMKALYPFVGGTAGKHSYNFMNTAAYQITWNGGLTHSSNGVLPNGTNGYGNTGFLPSSLASANSNSIGYYIRTVNTAASADPVNLGSFLGSDNSTLLNTASTLASRLNSGLISGSITGGTGFFSSSRTSSTVTTVYKNSTSVATGNSGGGLNSLALYIGTLNLTGTPYASGYVNSQFAFAYMGDGLSSTEIGNFYTAVQAFQTTLSRQV
jgi:hypothetical protein